MFWLRVSLPSWLPSPRRGFLALAQWVSAHLSRDDLLLSVKSTFPQLTYKWRWLALPLFHFSLHFPPLLLPLTHQKQFFRRLEIEREGLKRKGNHSGRHAHLHKHPVYSIGMSWLFSSMAAAASGNTRPMLHGHSVTILEMTMGPAFPFIIFHYCPNPPGYGSRVLLDLHMPLGTQW